MKEANLPVIQIHNDEFEINLKDLCFQEKGNFTNKIFFRDMIEKDDGYIIPYNFHYRNIPAEITSANVRVEVPTFVSLIPQLLSKHYNIPVENIAGKTDFEIFVNEEHFKRRTEFGFLPEIEIIGHQFYVDLLKGKLVSKDEFSSKDIEVSALYDYYDRDTNTYFLPFDFVKGQIKALDYGSITEIPNDWNFVQIPILRHIDPIGWNRINGFDDKKDLKFMFFKMDHKAMNAPWNETLIPTIIKNNIEQKTKNIRPNEIKERKGRKI